MADHNHVIVYADGGSRGNPGTAGSGTVVYAADGRTVLREIVYVVGRRATNNVAEYHGMLRGLEAARDLGARTVDVHMDSKLVVEQMSGRWKIKHPDMQALALEARRLVDGFDRVTFTWVPRAKNSAADALSNTAMDAAAAGHEPGIVGGAEVASEPVDAEPVGTESGERGADDCEIVATAQSTSGTPPTGAARPPRRPASSCCATARRRCPRRSSTPATPTPRSPRWACSRPPPRPGCCRGAGASTRASPPR